MKLRPNKIGVQFLEYKRTQKVFSIVYRPSIWYHWKRAIIKEYEKHIEESFELADVIILFVLSKDLADNDFYSQLLQETRKDKNKLLPIITLGTDPLKTMMENRRLGISPKANYLDHSRWNKYFNLDVVLKKDSRFKKAIEFFVHNKSKDLTREINYYDLLRTNVALEYVEFHSRLLDNSRLEKFGEHANYVQPFVFHSEEEMRNKYLKPEDSDEPALLDLIQKKKKNLKWRILLIDDHVDENSPLSPFDRNDTKNHTHLTKQKLVSNLLEEDSWLVGIANKETYDYEVENNDIVIVPVSNINDAVDELTNTTYDIILLDFLLGYTNNNREFGYELLSRIENEHVLRIQKNPLNYFWILIMSGFQQAFLDKLREQGLSHHSNHWHLARGADPVNTPELFKYNLYKLMGLQILEVEFTRKRVADHFKRHFSECDYSIRSWSKSYYQIFISKYGKIHNLKTNKKSLFSTSYSKYFTENRKSDLIYYEKMRNFLFLLAHGSVADSVQLHMSFMEVSKEMEWEYKMKQRILDYINTMH